MFSYTDLKPGAYIVLDGQPYAVLDFSFSKKQRQQATVQTKLKNIKTGQVMERAFHQSDKIAEADIEKKEMKFLYVHRGEYWFCRPDNPKDRFKLEEEIIGSGAEFLKTNSIVTASLFEDEIIGVKVPIKMDLKVAEAPSAVKGNTAQGAVKQVKLETGAVITAPIFISLGDTVRVNTEKGEYVERVSKVQ